MIRKIVTEVEMNELLEKSKDSEYPYLWKFSYNPQNKEIVAKGQRKYLIRKSIHHRRRFHTNDIDLNSVLGNAYKKMEELKINEMNANFIKIKANSPKNSRAKRLKNIRDRKANVMLGRRGF